MDTLAIDIEAYSDVSLPDCGVHMYAASEQFEILLFAYSLNDEPTQIIDLASGEKIPDKIMEYLTDDSVIKTAYNAAFERNCINRFFGLSLKPEGWRCTLVQASMLSLPLSLEGVGEALNLDKKKMSEGKDLIRYFCMPCKPTKINGGRKRNLPQHDIEKWKLFVSYNKRDVEVEMAIQGKLANFPVPDFVWQEYCLDQEINDRGIALDMDVVTNAISIDEYSKNQLITEMKKLTGLENPNSVQQMKQWLSDNGLQTESLDKKTVATLLKTAREPLNSVLTLRQQLAKSSVKKYQVMENAVCEDGRARGMFQFYGANRSGRWAGRLIQLQNLPQNHLPDLEQARSLVKADNYDALKLLYEDIPDTLSQLIRTAFVPRKGMKFVVADFSAIEARVLSFLAGETWRSEVFANGGDIYCESASKMFHVPVEKHGVNSHLRQKGKIAELALGYGGSVGALKSMGALDMGLAEEELQPLVDAWRSANPMIVQFWWDVDRAVKTAVKQKITTEVNDIRFICKSGMLFIKLPSSRMLSYVKPRMGENKFGGESVTYEGVGATKKWERIESYGPKFVENIVQAISRDILAYAMRTLSHCFICGHVHDELIIECSKDVSVDAICEQMGRTPPWIKGLLLRADGYETEFYKKD